MMIEIIAFSPEHATAFRNLNLEWLNKFNLTESHDLMVLGDPESTIIDRGGFIFLARSGEEIVGSAGLMKEHDGVFELAKMAVAPAFRGMGISKLLIEKCIDKAKELHAKKLLLFSNSQLRTAISLYEKYGFRHVPVVDTPFLTADIKMELSL
ncbi:MAG TPA: GNAT family N-acetyltransferase [Panacibacter sp.]|nr:GNAT family N-acetyltransferase [Panacibacter sp.]HNP45515.1 GNAT family N-acetyltransferase [Panacibacter sp.]